MEKILLTVFETFSVFFNAYPDSIVGFTGSTPSRTRLYRIAISHELKEILKLYHVWGLQNEVYKPFEKNTHYTSFLISIKGINIV